MNDDIYRVFYIPKTKGYRKIVSYGGGVLEILPGEMGNILLPKAEMIDPALRDKLLAHIDAIVRNDEDIELALDVVDKELLV